jgi:hypothetical protein
MPEWVEQVVRGRVRIVASLADMPRRGRPSLTYMVRDERLTDHGPFDTFEAAMAVACDLAPAERVVSLRGDAVQPSEA